MSTLTIVLITIVATFVVLGIIGSIVGDVESNEEVFVPNENELGFYIQEQKRIFEGLVNNRPSTFRNSMIMQIIRVITFMGTTFGIGIMVYVGFTGINLQEENIEHNEVMIMLLFLTGISFILGRLAAMIIKRNSYIDSLEELLSSEPKQFKKR